MRSENIPHFLISVVFAISFCYLIACDFRQDRNSQTDSIESTDLPSNNSPVKHAIGFDIIDYQDYKLLHFFRHFNDEKDTLSYLLTGKNVSGELPYGYPIIKTPIENLALLHTSYISFVDFCESLSSIIAVSEDDYLFHYATRQRISAGTLPQVGHSEKLNMEKLLEINPELVITVGFPNSPNKNKEQLESLGYPVLVMSEWQESSLLGRMEWVKIFGLLFEQEDLVNDKFNDIESNYLRYREIASKIVNRPRVICNAPYKESWYVPAGDSYASNLIQDAGGDYLWHDTEGTGGIPLDFETVFANGHDAEYWINPGVARKKSDLVSKDERLMEFKALREDKTYHSFRRSNDHGGNDYWESGLVNPDLILADLIKILHPDILPEHELFYYEKLSD